MGQALEVLSHMSQQDRSSLIKAYKSLLHTCMKSNNLTQAKQVYVHLNQRVMIESAACLGDHVIYTFIKCGGLDDALQVFNRLPRPSVSSWSSLIAGYSMSGNDVEALEVHQRMMGEGVKPDRNTFVILLKACGNIADLEKGRLLHAEVVKHGEEADLFVRTCLVDMYGRCGSVVDAQNVFDAFLFEWDVVAWNALLAAYAQLGQGEKALILYEQMLQEGISPNGRTYVSLFRASGVPAAQEEGVSPHLQHRNVQRVKVLHSHVSMKSLDSNTFVANTLIALYGRCGSIADAQVVFDRLFERSIVSWNAILAACAQQGLATNALQLYEEMLLEGIVPNGRTYITLIGVFGKCGHINTAQNIFDGLPKRNVMEWNALLAAYASLGQGEKVLKLYIEMHEEQVSPDGWTSLTVLQACGMCSEGVADAIVDGQRVKVEVLAMVKAIHADARKRAYIVDDGFISRTLISAYGRSGSIMDAWNVFDGLSDQNVVSFNAILAALHEQRQGGKAFHVYEQMLDEGTSPNARTFVSVLQVCSSLGEQEAGTDVGGQLLKLDSLPRGLAVHECAHRKGYDSDVFVGSALVTMYGRCGCIAEAEFVFDRLSSTSVVLWNAMIAAYVEHKQAHKALELYEEMQREGVSSDARTMVNLVQVCRLFAEEEEEKVNSDDTRGVKLECLKLGKSVHVEARRRHVDSDVFVGNSLICLYGKCGSVMDAQAVFGDMVQRDVVSWNAMLTACVEQHLAEEALVVYTEMVEQGVKPDAQTFLSLFAACAIVADKEEDVAVQGMFTKARALETGKCLHAEAWKMGYDWDEFVGNKLVYMYGRCGSVADARTVFDRLSQRDVVAQTAMLAAYFKQGQGADGMQLYKQLRREEGLRADDDEISLVCMLQGCGSSGNLDVVREMHRALLATWNNPEPSPALASALITAYGRCSSMVDAQAVFDAIPRPNVVLWNSLIAAYARQGDCVKSVEWYERMLATGAKPDRVTFVSVLYACSHAGLVDKGVHYFESMSRDYGTAPEVEHYVSMVDLLGRAGYFDMVELVLSAMPMQPNLACWLCLLGACQKQGKVALAELAFRSARRLAPEHAAAYVLMANIYCDAGLSGRAEEVRKLRLQRGGVLKRRGQSWIEHDEKVHSFVVGDVRHPRCPNVYDMYESTNLNLYQR